MQEGYAHLTKRYAILNLFHTKSRPTSSDDKWHDLSKYDYPNCENACIVEARFENDHQEEVFFCNRLPHWWYVNPKGRPYVIQDNIVEWRYLQKQDSNLRHQN